MQENQDFSSDGYVSVDQPCAVNLFNQRADWSLYEFDQRPGLLH